MRLVFDRGTLLFDDVPSHLDPRGLHEVLWDARVGAFRAPARLAYPLLSDCKRRGVPLLDSPRPKLAPPSGFRPLSLRPYQEAALTAWRLGGRRGVVALPTGSGKTRIALAAMAATRAPALCLVPTRALLGQWLSALREVYGGPVGCLGDGAYDVQPVTVATFASAYRHMQRLGDHFGLLVIDEVHHFGQARKDEALDMAIAPLRLGLTATLPEPGPAAVRLARLVGPVLFELSVASLTGAFLAPLDRVTLRLWLDREEQREYDELRACYAHAFAQFRLRHAQGDWQAFLRTAMQSDDGRRALGAWRRARRLLAYPRCKRRALAALLGQIRDRRTLVFVADNETAYAIARDQLIMPLTCDIGRPERETMLARFRAGELRALVSAQVLNEGLDVPDADVGIVVGGTAGVREHTQRVGRLLRPGQDKRALVYELVVQRSGEVRQAERRWGRLAVASRTAA